MYANKEMLGDLVNDVGMVGQLLGSAGAKLCNFFVRKPKEEEVVDPELLRTRELQSAKIELRLLGRQKRFDEVLAIATATEHDDIARFAVYEIIEGDLETNDRIQFLAAIANSFSRAAVPATVTLYNCGEIELALSIFLERLANGELARLVQSGRAKLLSVLDLLGALDRVQETEHSSKYFDDLFHSLSAMPNKQVEALMQILGDPKPSESRGNYSDNSVTQAVKLKAINLLQYIAVDDKDRALSYAAKDEDDVIAHRAVMSVMQLWQSQNINGMVPQGLEPFPLLNTNMLVQLCKMSAAFQWQDGIAANAILKEHSLLSEQLDQIDQEADPAGHARIYKQLERIEDDLRRVSEQRINMIQPLINGITQALGIPNADIATSDDPRTFAVYAIGRGRIELNRQILFDDRPLSEELMSTLLHELGHMEQDVLVLRMIADDLNLKFGQHAELLYPLYERYAAGIGYAPHSMFLLAVLRLRADRPLNAAQRQRALRLHHSAYDIKMSSERLGWVTNRLTRLNESYDELDSGTHDGQLLPCLSNTKAIAGWFARGAVPAVLLYEIENCKQDLALIFDRLTGGTRPRDIVAWAYQAYHSGHKAAFDAVDPIVQRLRTLLMQVLGEEIGIMEKELSVIRRSGYHEAEAYTISDRVEVIVKALRRNW